MILWKNQMVYHIFLVFRFPTDDKDTTLSNERDNDSISPPNGNRMGDWVLSFEVTALILFYGESVDISSIQCLRCVCKTFKLVVDTSQSQPHVCHIYPEVLHTLRVLPSQGQFCISVCLILQCAGTLTVVILHFKLIVKLSRWNHTWLKLCNVHCLEGTSSARFITIYVTICS